MRRHWSETVNMASLAKLRARSKIVAWDGPRPLASEFMTLHELWMNIGCAVKPAYTDFLFAAAGLGNVVIRLHPH